MKLNCSVRCIKLLLVLAYAIVCHPSPGLSADQAKSLTYEGLVMRLVQEGLDEKSVRQIYKHPQTGFEIEGVSLFFMHSEGKLNYRQFLKGKEIRKARAYMETHRDALLTAEKQFGVEKEIITAIISVETRLGTYLGNRSIINTLSTLAILSDPELRGIFWKMIPETRRVDLKVYEEKARKRSQWAYDELKAFIPYAWREGFDPAIIKGSYAGAMGIAQFMPSNIITLGIDGDKDGRIDLFSHVDAIASIGNYLKHYGWRLGMKRKSAYRVLLHYNRSKPYANTILDVAEKLSSQRKAP